MHLIPTKRNLDKEIKVLIKHNKGWCGGDNFTEILKKERTRSERTGVPISYILIELSSYNNGKHKFRNGDYVRFLKILSKLITKNTREFDQKFFLTPYKLAIILIDTCLNDAKVFVDRISQNIYQHFESENNDEFIHIIKNINAAWC